MYEQDFGKVLLDDFEVGDVDSDDIKTHIVGSGSIGQVYKLYNRKLGKFVAVKVKHPGIDASVHNIVNLIKFIHTILDPIANIPFATLLNDFIGTVLLQIDYVTERNNIERFAELYANESHVVIPEVFYSSRRFIVMSYNDGVKFSSLNDKTMKLNVSLDLNCFIYTSILIHDFVHCDLHNGNWKIQISDTNPQEYKLVIYDCGIVASTNDLRNNQKIIASCFDSDWMRILNIVIAEDIENTKKGKAIKEYTEEVNKNVYCNASERFKLITKHILLTGLKINFKYLRLLQASIICEKLMSTFVDRITKLLGGNDSSFGKRVGVTLGCILCILRRVKKYDCLLQYFEKWREDVPEYKNDFLDWLYEEYGHRDEDVFSEVIYTAFVSPTP